MDPQDVEVKEVKVPAPSSITVDQKTQALVARDNSELVRIIRIMMRGMAFPKTLDTEDKVIAAWQIASSLKIPPAIAIQNIAIINGSACIWGQLPKALAETTGELQEFKLLRIDKDQKIISLENGNLDKPVWGAVLQIQRKGRSINEYAFTMDDAKKAGLDKKPGPWTQYTATMLCRRVVAQGIKFEFPDALMGVSVAEYDINDAPDLKDVTPAVTATVNEEVPFEERVRQATSNDFTHDEKAEILRQERESVQ